MAQEKALLEVNAKYGVTIEEQEKYNDYVYNQYVLQKLEESEAFAAANPDAWTDGFELLAEWEQWDKEDGIYEEYED